MNSIKNQQAISNTGLSFQPPSTLHPIVTPIHRVTKETPRIKAFTLKAPKIAQVASPGQFIMVWIPGIDEIPMSLSSVNLQSGYIEFAVARLGDATAELHKAKKGNLLGLRGPLGQGYKLPDPADSGPILLVGGGCGASPLSYVAGLAIQRGFEVHIVLGATTKAELLFYQRFKAIAKKIVIATDDGSEGIMGTAVDATSVLLKEKHQYAVCLSCGPEAMIINLQNLIRKYSIPLQATVERYMKCGVGLCGHCIIDDKGTRVCKEGPVFDIEKLQGTDLGVWTRDSTGTRKPVQLHNETCDR